MRVNKKKMAAAGISVLLASGLLVGSVEYASHTFALSKAAAAGNTKTVTESVNTKAAKKADASKVSKEETVYVTMDANGKKDEVIVSDWLKNAGINGKISDVSDLKDIQNTKGNEKFTQDDSTLTWDAKKNDIYYQGTSDKELPVGMEISYKLDGKEIYGLPATVKDIERCEPVYEELPGWKEDITHVKSFEELPVNCQNYIHKIEELVHCPVRMFSVGPDREQTVVLKDIKF